MIQNFVITQIFSNLVLEMASVFQFVGSSIRGFFLRGLGRVVIRSTMATGLFIAIWTTFLIRRRTRPIIYISIWSIILPLILIISLVVNVAFFKWSVKLSFVSITRVLLVSADMSSRSTPGPISTKSWMILSMIFSIGYQTFTWGFEYSRSWCILLISSPTKKI